MISLFNLALAIFTCFYLFYDANDISKILRRFISFPLVYAQPLDSSSHLFPIDTIIPNSTAESLGRLSFDPEILIYENSPVCIPSTADFKITNNLEEDLELYSITSENKQFYPVLFQPQTLKSKNSISIQLLFLPYQIASYDSNVSISTSSGEFLYTIKGNSVGNPYNLYPLSGFRVPAGVPYEQSIIIHNPYQEPLYVREIFTTEEFLSLKGLDSDGQQKFQAANVPDLQRERMTESQVGLWEIKSNEDKHIVTLSMMSPTPGNLSGYLHIKTDRENIVLPVSIYVLEGGLFPVPATLDFGTITMKGASQTVELSLFNSGNGYILIDNIFPAEQDSNILIKLSKLYLHPGEESVIALVTFTADATQTVDKKLLVITNNTNPAMAIVEVPYKVNVLLGKISVLDPEKLIFRIPTYDKLIKNKTLLIGGTDGRDGSNELRSVNLYNSYPTTSQIVSISTSNCFNYIVLQSKPAQLSAEPFKEWEPMVLKFNKYEILNDPSPEKLLPLKCSIEIQTTTSGHTLDVYIIHSLISFSQIERILLDMYNFENDRVKLNLNKANYKNRKFITKSKKYNQKNIETFEIFHGFLSVNSPKILEIYINNFNPVAIPFFIPGASIEMKLCAHSYRNNSQFSASPIFIHEHIVWTNNSTECTHFQPLNSSRSHSEPLILKEFTSYLLKLQLIGNLTSHCVQEGICVTAFDMQTPYQVIRTKLFYHPIQGDFLLELAANCHPRLVAGYRSGLLFKVVSLYPVPVENFHMNFISDIYNVTISVRPEEQANEVSLQAAPAVRYNLYVEVNFLDAILGFSHLNEISEVSTIYGFIHRLLSTMKNLTDYDLIFEHVKKIDSFYKSKDFSSLNIEISMFNNYIVENFGSYIRLPPLKIDYVSEFAEGFIVIQNILLEVPNIFLPNYYQFEFPAIRLDSLGSFDVEVYNPFNVPVRFQFLQETNDLISSGYFNGIHYSNKVERLQTEPKNHEFSGDYDIDPSILSNYSILQAIEIKTATFSKRDMDFPVFQKPILMTDQFFIIPPQSSMVIGPNLYNPNIATQRKLLTYDIYFLNNFTGAEKLTIKTIDYSPRIHISELKVYYVNEPVPLVDNLDTYCAQQTYTYACFSIQETKTENYFVNLTKKDAIVKISITNSGKTPTDIDFSISGIYYGDSITFKRSAFSPKPPSGKHTTLNPGATYNLYLEAYSDCTLIYEKASLLVSSSVGIVSDIKIDLDYFLSDIKKSQCLSHTYSPFVNSFIKISASIVILICLFLLYRYFVQINNYIAIRKLNLAEIAIIEQKQKELTKEKAKLVVSEVNEINETSLLQGSILTYINRSSLKEPIINYLPKDITLCDIECDMEIKPPVCETVEKLLKKRAAMNSEGKTASRAGGFNSVENSPASTASLPQNQSSPGKKSPPNSDLKNTVHRDNKSSSLPIKNEHSPYERAIPTNDISMRSLNSDSPADNSLSSKIKISTNDIVDGVRDINLINANYKAISNKNFQSTVNQSQDRQDTFYYSSMKSSPGSIEHNTGLHTTVAGNFPVDDSISFQSIVNDIVNSKPRTSNGTVLSMDTTPDYSESPLNSIKFQPHSANKDNFQSLYTPFSSDFSKSNDEMESSWVNRFQPSAYEHPKAPPGFVQESESDDWERDLSISLKNFASLCDDDTEDLFVFKKNNQLDTPITFDQINNVSLQPSAPFDISNISNTASFSSSAEQQPIQNFFTPGSFFGELDSNQAFSFDSLDDDSHN